MTVIAWDGTTLAADKLANNGGLIMKVTKLFKVRGCLVGGTGDFDRVMEVIAWFAAGAEPSKLPPFQRSNEDWTGLLVIEPDKTILKYERSTVPHKIESPFWAIGSGRDFAMAAMHLGKSACEAVEVASDLCTSCGMGVDWMRLE